MHLFQNFQFSQFLILILLTFFYFFNLILDFFNTFTHIFLLFIIFFFSGIKYIFLIIQIIFLFFSFWFLWFFFIWLFIIFIYYFINECPLIILLTLLKSLYTFLTKFTHLLNTNTFQTWTFHMNNCFEILIGFICMDFNWITLFFGYIHFDVFLLC